MPTANRPDFARQAVKYFLNQDYPNRELVVIDDGSERILEEMPADPRINHIRFSCKRSIGYKRNLGCEAAKGTILVCWDDDDWYGCNRISHQVTPILEGAADVTGLGNSLFLLLSTGQFWASDNELQTRMFLKGIVGGTLTFRKQLWSKGARFPDTSMAEDAECLKTFLRRGARVKQLSNDGTFIYVRHDANSWQFTPGEFLLRRRWRSVDPPGFLPAEDLRFYQQYREIRAGRLKMGRCLLGEHA